MFRRVTIATLVAAALGTGPSLADPTAFPSFPAPSATPQPRMPATATPALAGPMAAYAWFPGRWACRTASTANLKRDPAPGKLYVVSDPTHGAIKEYFSMTTPDGKPYRSDDVLTYDAAKRAFVRRSIDQNGAQVLLAAKAPYAATMTYGGFLALQSRKIYRMRANVFVDTDETQMTTATAFYQAATKRWAVQNTTVCTKI